MIATEGRTALPDPPGAPRIVLAGATGRLGRSFAAAALAEGWILHGLVGGPFRDGTASRFDGIAGPIDPGPVHPPRALPGLLAGADIYVGAAPAEAERALLPAVARAGVPAVVAGTGFGAEDREWLADVERRIPLVRETNFSLGLAHLRAALRSIGTAPGFEPAVLEAHRSGKRDRPSASAIQLAGELCPQTGPEGSAVPTVSIRGGDLPGVHQVWWSGRHELLRFEHLVLDRAAFAEGMAAAVRELYRRRGTLAPGPYALAELLARSDP